MAPLENAPDSPLRPAKDLMPESDGPEYPSELSSGSDGSLDPMNKIFAGALFASPDDDDEAPDELRDIFEREGLGDRTYKCAIKQKDYPSAGQTAYLKSINGKYPGTEWLTNNYGPGEYILQFGWRKRDPQTGKPRNQYRDLSVTISDKMEDQYKDFQLKQRLARMQSNRMQIHKAKLEKQLEDQFLEIEPDNPKGEKVDPRHAAKAYIAETIETAKALGLTTSAGSKPPVEWDKVITTVMGGLSLIVPLLQDSARRREDQIQNMMNLMLTMQGNSSNNMLELMKAQTGPVRGNDMMKELFDMVKSAMNIKSMFEPKEETLADKVFGLVESIAPQLVSVLSLPPEKRQVDIRTQFAQNFVANNPEMQALKQDPREMAKLIERLDSFFGWEQSDIILQVMTGGEMVRDPAVNQRRPDQRYPHGDQRNNPPVEGDVEIVDESNPGA